MLGEPTPPALIVLGPVGTVPLLTVVLRGEQVLLEAEIEQLTEGDVDTSMPAWSGDGSTIFFVQERVQISGEAISGNRNRLYALDLGQRVISELGEVDASDSGYPTWVP